MSRTVGVLAALAAIIAIAAVLMLKGRFSPEARRERTLRNLNTSGVIVRRACGLGEAYVDGARWTEMRDGAREEAAEAVASWCAEQGGSSTLTIFDANSRARLGRWNGSQMEQ